MQDKKQIDRLFQEKFKNFDVKPDDAVWKQIEARLNKNKKRRIIPIWWRYAGVAALLLLLLTISNSLLNNSKKTISTPQVVESEEAQRPLKEKESILNTPEKNTSVSNADKSDSGDNNSQLENTQLNTIPSNTAVVKNNLKSEDKIESNQNINLIKNKNKSINAIASQSKPPLIEGSNKTNKSISKQQQIALNTIKNKENPSSEVIIKKKDAELLADNKNSVKDSTQNNSIEDKLQNLTIEDAIASTEDIIEKERLKNRWSISPNIAPVYYNTLGDGSHIDNQLINSAKSGDFNTSFGFKISYAINKRLNIRSGIQDVNLTYNTNEVILFRGISSTLANVDQMRNITFYSEAQRVSAISSNNSSFQQTTSLLPKENASISQHLGYLEIPLEIQYEVINKTLGVNIIGGFSTFFLNDNDVVTDIEGLRTLIGEANNINDISFSANFGIGVDYKFSEKFKFNLEPTFKYQINAYNDTFGDFKPYIFGVYTGFSFKF